jgi:nicotinamide mononucleotide transporter
VSILEIAAFVLGVVNVWLVVRRSVWNYPFALAMVALYAHIFFDAKLYSDAGLQIFYIFVNLYGWWSWSRVKAETGDLRVERLSVAVRLAWLAGCAAATAGWGWIMHLHTDAAFPWWDAAVAMMSVAAQILMTRRYLENWLLWIAVDMLAIGLFASKGLWLTVALYVIFLGLSIWGLMQWARVRASTPA